MKRKPNISGLVDFRLSAVSIGCSTTKNDSDKIKRCDFGK
jgi:hypothetical protein